MIIRDPPSRPLSSYRLVDAEEFASGYRGLVMLPDRVTRELTSDAVDISTPLTKYRSGETPAIRLNIPFLSAAMQAVSGPRMGIALARMGGLADIYCSQPVEEQAYMVRTVKRHKGAFIEPEVVAPDDTLEYVAARMRTTGYSKFFVTEGKEQNGRLLGVITVNDFDEELHYNLPVSQRMQPVAQLDVVYDDEVGYDVRAANQLAKESHHSALPVLYRDGRLRDVIFRKDIHAHREHKDELLDAKKRLMVAAAVNTHDYRERVPALVDAGADVLIIDTSQGYSDYVKDASHFIRNEYPGVPLIGGNIVTAEGFRFLVEECGVDGVKAGMGIGSICITPEQIGVARGQDRAIEEVARARDEYFTETGVYVPIIADGGMSEAHDILIALSLGADSAMLGRMLAGTDESPTKVNYNLSPPQKLYWGEGSERARNWRERRGYSAAFEEGVEGWVPYVGLAEPYLTIKIAKIRDGMKKVGCRDISHLHRYVVVEVISEDDVGTRDLVVERR